MVKHLFRDSQLNCQRGYRLVLAFDRLAIFIKNLHNHFLAHMTWQTTVVRAWDLEGCGFLLST